MIKINKFSVVFSSCQTLNFCSFFFKNTLQTCAGHPSSRNASYNQNASLNVTISSEALSKLRIYQNTCSKQNKSKGLENLKHSLPNWSPGKSIRQNQELVNIENGSNLSDDNDESFRSLE